MTTQHDKAKRWQFGMKWLLLVVTVVPMVAGGVFGEAIQRIFFASSLMLAWSGLLMLPIIGIMRVAGNMSKSLERSLGKRASHD
jgi:hypothetical protein